MRPVARARTSSSLRVASIDCESSILVNKWCSMVPRLETNETSSETAKRLGDHKRVLVLMSQRKRINPRARSRGTRGTTFTKVERVHMKLMI